MPPPSKEPIRDDVISPIDEDWEMDIGMGLTGAEARKVRAFIRSYRSCFAFKLTNLEGYKGRPIGIQLEDDHPVFRRPYRLSLSEREGVRTRCRELLSVGLVELSD